MALTLMYITNNPTIAEIAERYGMSESKVKTQLHRTRTKLHSFLEKEGITV